MSDTRYKKLYSLPSQLYAVKAPVVIEAGALLKDTQADRVIAQLKLKNVNIRTIKAVTVEITPFNVTGQALGTAIKYQYLDLEAGRDKHFGNKTAIRIPEPTTRSFTVSVSQVVYADGSMWEDTGAEWKRLPTPRTLEDALEDNELAKQFQLEFGEQCKFWPAKVRGLWYCTCGAINLATEKKCHKCGLVLADLADADFDELENQRDRRIAKERKVAKRKANIKIAISVIFTTALVALAIVAYITQSLIPDKHYNEAVELFNDGKYDEAIAAFEKLGDYKDSAEQIKTVEQTKQAAREDEIDSLIEETKESIAPYIEVLSQETNGLELEVTQEFVDNIGSVNVMGYTGTVSHGASDMVNIIDIMEWTCNDTSTEDEFVEFTELLERYYGKAPEIREAEGISDNTYFWVDHDNLCIVMAWYADSFIHARWDFVPDIVTPA